MQPVLGLHRKTVRDAGSQTVARAWHRGGEHGLSPWLMTPPGPQSTGSGAHQPEPVGARRHAETLKQLRKAADTPSKRPTAPFRLARRQPTRALALAQLFALGRRRRARDRTAGTASWRPNSSRPRRLRRRRRPRRGPDRRAKLKVSGSFLALVLAMVLLGGPPAALIGVVTIASAGSPARRAHYLLHNLVAYAWFPLLGASRSTCAEATGTARTDGSSTSSSSAPSSWRWPSTSLLIAGYTVLAGGLLLAKARKRAVPVLPSELRPRCSLSASLPLREIGIAASPCSASSCSPSSTCSAQLLVSEQRARLRSSSSRRQAARQPSGRAAQRAAPHARPARPDDRPPQRRGRALRARDRARSRAVRGASRSSSTPPACCTTSASSSSPTTSSRATRAHRRGLADHPDAPVPGRADRLPDRGLRPGRRDHPRPPRAHRRQGLPARPQGRRDPGALARSSPSPTPTT